MNDAMGMTVSEGLEKLLHNDGSFRFRKGTTDDPIVKRKGFTEVGNQTEVMVVLENVD